MRRSRLPRGRLKGGRPGKSVLGQSKELIFEEKGNTMSKLGGRHVVPILVIVVGVGWLLNVKGVIPKVDWIWTCGLAAVGFLTLAVGGLDKLTVVVGPFLIVSSIFSVLRQTGNMSIQTEVPILTIVLGVLLLFVNLVNLPSPDLLKEAGTE